MSIGRLAVFSLGPAALVLVVAAVLVVTVRPGPVVALVIIAVGLVGSVAVMGFVSRRMVDRALAREDAEQAPHADRDA
ncbi:hypothetical protein GCM10023147_37860 [Tsukamurella soli]|uniref:Uncharacterized protein n=1 Tax=Tsukamurella soli TaxID=644556 RepID=A0ABP8K487_9ACTN